MESTNLGFVFLFELPQNATHGNKCLIKYWWHAGQQSNEPHSIKTCNRNPRKIWHFEETSSKKPLLHTKRPQQQQCGIIFWMYVLQTVTGQKTSRFYWHVYTLTHILTRPHRLDNNVVDFNSVRCSDIYNEYDSTLLQLYPAYVYSFSLLIMCTYRFVHFFVCARSEQ